MNSQFSLFFISQIFYLEKKKNLHSNHAPLEKYKHFIQKMYTLYYIYSNKNNKCHKKFYEKYINMATKSCIKVCPRKTGEVAVKL